MHQIEKTFYISMGHRLSKHKGKCKNIHGHNLKIKVGVKSEKLNDQDMVIDFSDLKNKVKIFLDDWDHGLFLNINDKQYREIYKNFELNKNTIWINGDPTAEKLSKLLFKKLSMYLEQNESLELEYVKIYENENSMAMYSKD